MSETIVHADHLFTCFMFAGGGCPVGSILLIEEDRYCNYSRVLSKYFLAEGVRRKHGIFLATLEEDPDQLLRSVPRPVEDRDAKTSVDKVTPDETEDMRIAFRYNQLPKVNSEISGSSSTAYDLSTSIAPTDLDALHVTCYKDISNGVISSLKNVARQDRYSRSDPKNLLRICINSFGSPLWYSDSNFSRTLLTMLYQVRSVVRNTNSVCFVTIPGHLLRTFEPNLMGQIRNLVDCSIEIESFTGSDKEMNPVFKDYHGLLHIRKLSAVDTLAAFCPETNDLAFKLKRKRFVIEKLHLPPELGDDHQEGTSKGLPSMGCASVGGGGKNLLDF